MRKHLTSLMLRKAVRCHFPYKVIREMNEMLKRKKESSVFIKVVFSEESDKSENTPYL